MKRFYTSDLHFFHKLMVKERGFSSPEEMNEKIIANWNSVVSEEDEVYFLGDIALGPLEGTADCLKRLNGKIHWILGNHDHKKDVKKLSALFKFASIQSDLKIKIPVCHIQKDSQEIIMYHYPIAVWNKRHYGSFHLHGHSHGAYFIEHGFILDVGLDGPISNLTPISEEEVIEYMKTRTIGMKLDHHDSENAR